MTLSEINELDRDSLVQSLKECCHCVSWAHRVSDRAPFATPEALFEAADEAWRDADEQEVLEAFSGHPQIGDLGALRNRYAATASAEQGQVAVADDTVLEALRDRNEAYLERFGFIFIVCASGKSAEEMLALLDERLKNSRETELAIGAAEQGKIMRLRLEKLLQENANA